MGKKKEETIQDIIDRIEEDLITIRDKAQELEDSAVIMMMTRISKMKMQKMKMKNKRLTSNKA